MLTQEENRFLTEVEGDVPMGRWMRENHWVPCALSSQLEPGGAPERVRLLGINLVAFRADDGAVGVVNEACPHRGASLALARNEGGALTCIFHGWRIGADGCVLDAPSQLKNTREFAGRVPFRTYPVFEGGGLVWAWLGTAAPTERPNSPFTLLGREQVWMSRSVVPCNWLQGVEGTLDSVHLGTLHKSWLARMGQVNNTIGKTKDSTPRYDVQSTSYGLRAAALRDLPGGEVYSRISEYIMPFVTLVGVEGKVGGIFIAVPVDNLNHLLFFGYYDLDNPVTEEIVARRLGIAPGDLGDINNFATLSAGPEATWGQDRKLMKEGSFTGFGRNLIHEDVVVQASMGPVVDRTREYLSASDVAIVQGRRRLSAAVRAYMANRPEPRPQPVRDPREIFPLDALLPPGADWRDVSNWKAAAE